MAEPARQVSLPDVGGTAAERARARVREREIVRGERDRSDRSLSLTTLTVLHPRARPALLCSERRLIAWLRDVLQTAGATAMVRQYGARAVLDALYDGVVVREQFIATDETVDRQVALGLASPRLCEVRRWRAVPAPQLRSPGGFLRRLLEGAL